MLDQNFTRGVNGDNVSAAVTLRHNNDDECLINVVRLLFCSATRQGGICLLENQADTAFSLSTYLIIDVMSTVALK